MADVFCSRAAASEPFRAQKSIGKNILPMDESEFPADQPFTHSGSVFVRSRIMPL